MWELNIAQHFSVSPRDVYVRPFPFLYVPFRSPPLKTPTPRLPRARSRAMNVVGCAPLPVQHSWNVQGMLNAALNARSAGLGHPWQQRTLWHVSLKARIQLHGLCARAKKATVHQPSCDWLLLKSISYQSSLTAGAMATHSATRAQQQRLIPVCCQCMPSECIVSVLLGLNRQPRSKKSCLQRKKQKRPQRRIQKKVTLLIRLDFFHFLVQNHAFFFTSIIVLLQVKMTWRQSIGAVCWI